MQRLNARVFAIGRDGGETSPSSIPCRTKRAPTAPLGSGKLRHRPGGNSATPLRCHGLDARDLTRWPLAHRRGGLLPAIRGYLCSTFRISSRTRGSSPTNFSPGSELVACQRIHETGNIENLASAEWLARWKACRHLRTEQPLYDWSPRGSVELDSGQVDAAIADFNKWSLRRNTGWPSPTEGSPTGARGHGDRRR